MMTPIHAGSEDYFKQLNGLKTLPSDPATLQYLTHLLNNPNSPFEKFLVGGKIQQIEKDLAAQKGMQAQGQVGGGLPTIKDKLEQSASLLAAQSAAQGRGQMPTPAIPASSAAVSPEEEMQMSGGQPEEPMGMAHGGIMNVPLHDDTFSFAPGGIVAFSGGKKVTDEEKEKLANQTDAYITGALLTANENPQRDLEQMQKFQGSGSNSAPYFPPASGQDLSVLQELNGSGSNPTKYIPPELRPKAPPPDLNAAQRAATRKDLMRLPAMGLDILQAPMAGALNLAGAGATQVGNVGSKIINALIDKDVLPTNMNLNPGFNMMPLTSRLDATDVKPVPAPVARQPGDASIPRDQIPVMPGPSANVSNNGIVGSRRNMDQIMAEQAALQAARTKPIGSNAPSVARPTGENESLKIVKDEFSRQNKAIEDYAKEIPKDKSIADMVKDIRETDLAFGVGNYEKWAKEKFKERQARYDKQTEGRGRQDAMAQLAAYSRPGARWSDVLERDIQNKAKHLEEDKQFQTLQDNYEDSIYKMAEERSVGNAKDLRAAIKEQKTTKAAMLQHIMTAYNVPLQVAERMWASQAQTAEMARGHDLQFKASMANANSKNELAAARLEMAKDQFDRRLGANLETPAFKKFAEAKLKAQTMLSRLPDDSPLRPKLQTQIDNYDTEMDKIRQSVAGGIKSVNPAPAATTSNVPPRPAGAVQLIK
jgi:hypothetical protein